MAKKVELPDNLRYLYTKDAASGAQAGFNVQAVRDRLTEIQYDLDHIQGDIDQIINGDLSNIYQDIKDLVQRLENLKQVFNQFKVEIKNEIDNRFNEITKYIEAKFQEIAKQLENLGNELDEVKRTYEHFPTGTQMLFYQKSAPPGWSIVTGLDDSIIRVNGLKGGELVNGASFTQVMTDRVTTDDGSHIVSGNTSDITIGASSTTASTALSESQMPRHKHTGGVGNNGVDIGPRPYEGPSNHYSGNVRGAQKAWDATQGIGVETDLDGDNRKEVKTGTAYVVAPQWQTYTKRFDEPYQRLTNNDHTTTQRVTGWGMNLQPLDNIIGGAEAGGGAGHSHSYSFNAGSHSHTFQQNIAAHNHSISMSIKNISVIVCKKEIVF